MYYLHSLEIFRDGLQSKMVLIFTKTDKQDVIEVADFKTLSNKKKYQKNVVICHLILQIFLNTIK